MWAQFKYIVMESKSLSNVKDLYYIKKNLVKGEEYFTTSKSVILGAHILYLIIAGILIYSFYSKGISLTTYSLHLLILLIGVIAFYLILSFALYGNCIAIHKGKIKVWSGFYSYKEFDVKNIKAVYAVTTDTDDKGLYLVNKDDSVKKIGTTAYDKKLMTKILENIEAAIVKELPNSEAEEIPVLTVNPTAKQQAKELGKYFLYSLLKGAIFVVFALIVIGLIYLSKKYHLDVVLYVYDTFGINISPYFTPRNVFYAIALILGVYVLINKRKEKKDGKEE